MKKPPVRIGQILSAGRLAFIVLLFAVVAFMPYRAEARYASIVVEADTGRVLHAVNADTLNYPASLTKMMTLYLMFEAIDSGRVSPQTPLPVSRRAAGQAPARLDVKPGQTISAEEAILALVTKSANDVASVVAEALGGSEAKFALLMTKKARELGMRRTYFRNASGLPNRRQLTTAGDLAILSRALITDFPNKYAYFSTTKFSYNGRTYQNHNNLLASYEGTDGIKTGYIHASGYNLAASVERNGRRLIAVVLGGKTSASRDSHIKTLLDQGFVALAKLDEQRKQEAELLAVKGWGVQVGAYSRYAPAHLAVTQAARRVPDLLMRAKVSVFPVETDNGTVFRARLIGLSEQRARSACEQLTQKKVSCVTVPPINPEQAAATAG